MEYIEKFKTMKKRQMALQVVNLGMVLCGALVIYKSLMMISNSESPVVVVLSGSMEPGIRRGDLLVLSNWNSPIRTGEIVVYKVREREIPIVHRVIKVHRDGDQIEILTKGDNNMVDDVGLYRPGQRWLAREDIMGRSLFMLPYCGMFTILMNDYPMAKYALLGGLSLIALINGE